ncbi:MAG: hypothetical protein R3F65_25530 [bacterium]
MEPAGLAEVAEEGGAGEEGEVPGRAWLWAGPWGPSEGVVEGAVDVGGVEGEVGVGAASSKGASVQGPGR